MATDVTVPDWIQRIVDDERTRDAARQRAEEITAHKPISFAFTAGV